MQVEGIAFPVGGDLIIAIDKQNVEGMDDLIAYLVDNTSPGDSVTLTSCARQGVDRGYHARYASFRPVDALAYLRIRNG